MIPPTDFASLVSLLINLANPLLGVLAALALLVFLWGLASFIMKSGDAKTHEDGKNLMKWGLIALFIMASVLGIVRFLYNDLGFSRPFGIPTLPEPPAEE